MKSLKICRDRERKKEREKEARRNKMLQEGLVLLLVFPAGSVIKNPPANAGDTGSISDSGRSHMLQSN